MANFYDEMKAMAADLLKPADNDGFGQGSIILRKIKITQGNGGPWDDSNQEEIDETLNGAVKGVEQDLIGKELGGSVIQATDQEAITTPPIMEYEAGDRLVVDGKERHIISYTPIPAAGTTVATRFIIR